MSLFGQPQQQQQAAPSLFGGASTPQPAANNMFGANQSATQPKPLFGQPAAGSTPSLFGNTAAPTTNPSGGGLFGSNSTPASGGLFGQQQPAAAQPTGGLFGNTTTTQPAGNSLFGNTATTQPTASGGLFGSTPAAGSLFGAKPGAPTLPTLNTTAPAAGTSLFGGSTLGQQPTAQQNLFGQPAAQKPLFGAPAPTTNNLFGQSTNAAQGAPKPLFSTSMLGQPPAAQQPNSLGTSILTTSALRSPAPAAGAATQQADAQTQFARLSARIEEIAGAWNAASPQCQFQYFFYNRVEPSQVGLYGRPPNATNETLWTKAVRDNPDPTTLVPAIAVGFDDLRQRVDAQGQQASWQLERLKELKTRLESLSSTQHQNSARLARLAASQTQLMHQLLSLAAHLHLLVPSLRSSGIRVEEEELRGWLEELREEIGSGTPGHGHSGGRMRGKLGELWALVGAIGAQQQKQHQQHGEWKVVDEDGLSRIAQILGEQQAGLVHLTKILKGDLADINVVLKGGRVAQDGDGVDLLSSRRSVIR
ncbi:nucleoporin complex subunit 54-domain-containing protein [Roridomyces roridus]|uniref:Nucleoporin complex subunit 54-domain-containing protein n=1 Tax=Roridomyces roridus TaxID=1738132 RepID=A0AAD7FA86_9AGAR|nr:nucleoporin complex subunit 54-domain-containing protein [Roridomyces roridus]